MERRIITTDVLEEDVKIEGSLRPQRLDDYIGQEKTKKNLKVYIEAAKQRSDVLDHVLFYGPPGLGKTTLAGIIANEMGTHMKVTSGPAIEKPGEMAAILNNLQEGDVLFVDEILYVCGGSSRRAFTHGSLRAALWRARRMGLGVRLRLGVLQRRLRYFKLHPRQFEFIGL